MSDDILQGDDEMMETTVSHDSLSMVMVIFTTIFLVLGIFIMGYELYDVYKVGTTATTRK